MICCSHPRSWLPATGLCMPRVHAPPQPATTCASQRGSDDGTSDTAPEGQPHLPSASTVGVAKPAVASPEAIARGVPSPRYAGALLPGGLSRPELASRLPLRLLRNWPPAASRFSCKGASGLRAVDGWAQVLAWMGDSSCRAQGLGVLTCRQDDMFHDSRLELGQAAACRQFARPCSASCCQQCLGSFSLVEGHSRKS